MPPPLSSCRFALVIALLGALHSPPAAAGPRDPWKAYAPVFARIDSLTRRGAIGPAMGVLDSLGAVATSSGDRRLEMALTIQRARGQVQARQAAQAESTVRLVLPVAEARRDTLAWCKALRVLAYSQQVRGQLAPAAASYTRLLGLARRARLPGEEGWARIGLGNLTLDAARYRESIDQFRRATRLLERVGDLRGAMLAHGGLARVLQATQDVPSTRREHERTLALARTLNDVAQEANTTFNLGALEHVLGDPSKAIDYYQRCVPLYQSLGMTENVLNTQHAMAIVFVNRHQLEQADSILSVAVAGLGSIRNPDIRALVTCQLGILRREQGRFREGIELGRQAVAMLDSVSPRLWSQILIPICGTYEDAGQPQPALDLLDRELVRHGDRMGPEMRAGILRRRALILRQVGRPREALAALGIPSPPEAGGQAGYYSLEIARERARCYQDLGERDSARVWFGRTASWWERLRSGTGDAGWREIYDDAAMTFAGEYAAVLLAADAGGSPEDRARAAFDALQQFRARTLAERTGDGGRPQPLVRAAEFQARTLKDGEVFLDVYATPDTSIVIAVTRSVVRAFGAPPKGDWAPQLRRYRDLLGDPTSEAAKARTATAAQLGQTLFGPVADLVTGARRVIIAAGGLAQLPLATLVIPGESEPLIARHEVTATPSATLLQRSRVARAAPRTSERLLLAIARTADDQGHALPGAGREVRSLAASFAGVDARVDGAIGPVPGLLITAARYDVLHFASHTRRDAKSPARQALLLGDPRRPEAWLDAATISRRRLRARLCVMSGCASVGVRGNDAETLEGLATAWLAAGVGTVVATQWAVDDESMGELMHRFYQALARGETAAGALRTAQLELRAIPRFSHPYDWAGVVLLGDPDTRVRLVPRRRILPAVAP